MAEDNHRDLETELVEREFLAAWKDYAKAVIAHSSCWHRLISQATATNAVSLVKSPLYDELRTADNNRKDAQARFYDLAETYASILWNETENNQTGAS